MALVYNEKNKAFEYQKDSNVFDLLVPILFPVVTPISLVKTLVETINNLGKLSEDDTENIQKIIEEGRKQNVAEMEIEMSRDVAMGINIANIKGAEVTIGAKGDTKYSVKVKYK